ncbi:MAG: hypothetical protein QG583_823 [Patescibacteria group bacterium]|jgi:hypothetical protein|nr:hypothetical protein [Patescibacteria group bacterium]
MTKIVFNFRTLIERTVDGSIIPPNTECFVFAMHQFNCYRFKVTYVNGLMEFFDQDSFVLSSIHFERIKICLEGGEHQYTMYASGWSEPWSACRYCETRENK